MDIIWIMPWGAKCPLYLFTAAAVRQGKERKGQEREGEGRNRKVGEQIESTFYLHLWAGRELNYVTYIYISYMF